MGKTIENAQTRVEGYNFDIRKRVVEYDDVINKQRETIYAERDKVLRNEDLTATVRGFLDEEIEALVDEHTRRRASSSSGTIEGLAKTLGAMGLTGHDVERCRPLEEIGVRDDIIEHCTRTSTPTLEEREKQNGADVWAQVERFVLLRTIDTLWVDHLTELDDMRRGIGLRGYARHRSTQRVQARGVQALRGAGRLHPPAGRQYDLPRHGPGSAAAGGTAHALQPGRPGCGQRHVDVGWKRLRHGYHVQRRPSNRRQRATAGSSASSSLGGSAANSGHGRPTPTEAAVLGRR